MLEGWNMYYVNKQLEMKNRVIKTTCENGLVKVTTAAQTSRRPSMDHNITDQLRLQNVIHCLLFVSATRSSHCL
jgi:hypothetical protein